MASTLYLHATTSLPYETVDDVLKPCSCKINLTLQK